MYRYSVINLELCGQILLEELDGVRGLIVSEEMLRAFYITEPLILLPGALSQEDTLKHDSNRSIVLRILTTAYSDGSIREYVRMENIELRLPGTNHYLPMVNLISERKRGISIPADAWENNTGLLWNYLCCVGDSISEYSCYNFLGS